MSPVVRAQRRHAFSIAVVLVMAAEAIARSATAEPSEIGLDTTSCPSVSAAELRRIVAIERRTLLQLPSPTAGEAHILTIACDDQRAVVRMRLRLRDAPGVQESERTLSLQGFPADAAPRVLALAAIELLATVDMTGDKAAEGLRTDTANSSARPGWPSGARRSPRTAIALGVVRRGFLRARGLDLWGGRVELVHDRIAPLRFSGDVEAGVGSKMSELGDAQAVLLSMGFFGGLRASPTPGVMVSLVAGARGGLVRLQGMPAEGSGAAGGSVWRPWWGPALSLRATFGGPRVAAFASLEGGFTARGAEALAGTTTVLALRGGWVTVAAGVQF